MRIVQLTVTKKGEFGERAKKAEPWEFGIAFQVTVLIHEALEPNFELVLKAMPSMKKRATTLRIQFPSNPSNTISTLLDLISVSRDIEKWKEFFNALDQADLQETRKIFITDEQSK